MFYTITAYCKVMISNNVGIIRYVVAELLVPPEMECASLVYHLPKSDTVRTGSDDPFLFTKRPSSTMWNELIFILSIISGFGKKLGSSFENN